jgi:hypothetical protein
MGGRPLVRNRLPVTALETEERRECRGEAHDDD